MAFTLGTVLSTAPGLISAAAEIIRLLKKKKAMQDNPEQLRLDELTALLEQQARLIEELALNNRNMAIVVRTNRIFSIVALAASAISLSLWLFTH